MKHKKTNRKGQANYYANGGQVFDTIGQLAPLLNLIPGAGQIAAPLVGMGAKFLGNKAKQGAQEDLALNATNYTNSNAFGYADGGSLQPLNSTSQLVTGAPNQTDGNAVNYKGTQINLNHGETLDTNRDRVISDKYINPETGKKIIDEDKRLKSVRGRAEKVFAKTNDLATKNTIKRIQEQEDNLFALQEQIAMAKGDRNSDGSTVQSGQRYATGGQLPMEQLMKLANIIAQSQRGIPRSQPAIDPTIGGLPNDDPSFPTTVNYSDGNYPAFTPSTTPGIDPMARFKESATIDSKIPDNNKVSKSNTGSMKVKELQRILVEKGYDNIGKAGLKNDIDGVWGDRTKAALRDALASGKIDKSYESYLNMPSKQSSNKKSSKGTIANKVSENKSDAAIKPYNINASINSDFSNNYVANKLFSTVKGGEGYNSTFEMPYANMGSSPMGAIMDIGRKISPKDYKRAAKETAQDAIIAEVGGAGLSAAYKGARGLYNANKIAGYLPEGQKMLNAGQKMLNTGKVIDKVGKTNKVAETTKADWQFLKKAMETAKAAGNNEKAKKIAERMSQYSQVGRDAFATGGTLKSYATGTGPFDLKTNQYGPLLSNAGQYPIDLNQLGRLNYNTVNQTPMTTSPDRGPMGMNGEYLGSNYGNSDDIMQRSGKGNMWSDMTMGEKVGMGSAALSVALKATDAFGKVQKEPYRYNNAAISLNQLDPTAVLNNNQASYQSALNDLNNNSSTGANRQAIAANLFNNKLRANNDVMTKYGEANSNLATQYEQRLAQRNSENNQMSYQVDDMNSRNKGAAQQMRSGVWSDLATLGLDQANILNNKMSQNAQLEALKWLAPDVYAERMKNIKLK